MIADDSAIVAQGMGIRRGGRWLLHPVDFNVSRGVVGIAGPPGVGKSTLLGTIATLRRPQVGELDILGYDTGNAADLRTVRGRIGYLPDRFDWASTLTVRELVTYAAYYKRAPSAAVRNALRRMDLKEAGPLELSLLPDDVRLRAGFAATCVNEPDLVLLDEPLDGLDARDALHGTDLVPLIRALAPTVVLTSCSAENLAGWCDRTLTLAKGRLTEPPGRPFRRGGPAGRDVAGPTGRARPARPPRLLAGV